MAVGEVFLGAFLHVLFDRLAPHKLSLFPCEAGIRSELKQWKKKLLMIQAALDDAEEKQTKNEAVKMWLDDLRDLAYDVEDILDEYATQVVETELMSKQPTNRFADYFSVLSDLSPSSLISKVNIESKIEGISSRLEDLCDQRNDLGLKDIAGASSSSLWRRRLSTCVPIEPAIYGRDEDIGKILEMVLRDEADGAKFRAIPIVGMAGVGKTTLARQVYNDDAVKDFSIRIWVCVYYDFDILRISKAILESVTFSCCNLRDLNPVQVKLREAVAGKKFLLLLDDVWKMNYGSWEVLKSPFIAAAPGSKIILTTRSMEVASTVAGPTKSYELKLLSDDDCWSVFVKMHFKAEMLAHFKIQN